MSKDRTAGHRTWLVKEAEAALHNPFIFAAKKATRIFRVRAVVVGVDQPPHPQQWLTAAQPWVLAAMVEPEGQAANSESISLT